MPTSFLRGPPVWSLCASCRHIPKVGIPFRTTRIRKEGEAHGETIIRTTSRQHTGGAMKRKHQPEWMTDGRSLGRRVFPSLAHNLGLRKDCSCNIYPLGAAVGAGVGGGLGAGSEVITKGDQVKVPSETLLEFTLQQELSIRTRGSGT